MIVLMPDISDKHQHDPADAENVAVLEGGGVHAERRVFRFDRALPPTGRSGCLSIAAKRWFIELSERRAHQRRQVWQHGENVRARRQRREVEAGTLRQIGALSTGPP